VSGPFCNGGGAMTAYNQLTPQTEEEIRQAQLQQSLNMQSTPEYRKLLELELLIRKLSREIILIRGILEKEKTNAP
jgi:hypothetical protein